MSGTPPPAGREDTGPTGATETAGTTETAGATDTAGATKAAEATGEAVAAGPLLVLCALRPERWALNRGHWGAPQGVRAVLDTTGMGPDKARTTVSRLLSGPSGYGSLLFTGFCAAAAPGTRPGDAIVASEVGDASETSIEIPTHGMLADALRTLGLTVHTGLLYSADHVVRGAERARLYAEGAIGIDMETAAALRAAREAHPGLPCAAVRIVVDTPEFELIRPGTVRSGARAWRALRSAVPAFTTWHHDITSAAADGAQAAIHPRATRSTAGSRSHAGGTDHAPDSTHSTLPQEAR
jgi:hypothetical protein